MQYTKENFIKGEFAFINDGSKELESIINNWFPKDQFRLYQENKHYPYVRYDRQWLYSDFTGKGIAIRAIKAYEINNPKEWIGSEMEVWNESEWIPCVFKKYRLKQFPDHTEEIQRLAKEMNVTVKIEKI